MSRLEMAIGGCGVRVASPPPSRIAPAATEEGKGRLRQEIDVRTMDPCVPPLLMWLPIALMHNICMSANHPARLTDGHNSTDPDRFVATGAGHGLAPVNFALTHSARSVVSPALSSGPWFCSPSVNPSRHPETIS
ncbi:uncharacterized protein PV09_09207 [Verruconis gallopava]|uniref:Uncharacterized protein n=1 Tax=Verruconis gallopava TaxID=253628 RepID=A0A0D1YEH0_9PEZI|nr:uncharacterized protein PV09_09207 [Verruconis gallopava]KIV99111.1 hypothetical protein PV09_09207 [Verruconis gallopava]